MRYARAYRRFFAGVMALALAITMLQTPAQASTEDERPIETKTEVITEELDILDELPDNDELFAGYVENTLYGYAPVSVYGVDLNTYLNDRARSVYDQLLVGIKNIANGTANSGCITIQDTSALVWTYEELGITADSDEETIIDAVRSMYDETVSLRKIMYAVLYANPYDAYWFDKTFGVSCSLSYYLYENTGGVSQLEFRFYVCADYAVDGVAGTYDVNTKKTSATTTAVTNAKTIVTANASKPEYQKLVAYKEAICQYNTYNYQAASGGVSYGDPWQIIYVFDGDSETNVVCEGYSKAFQYLCDLSDFGDGTECYTVSGAMDCVGHMWNIVYIDGKYYHVDITNCDGMSIGSPDLLFLKGLTGSVADGYTFTVGNSSVLYTYDSDVIDLYGTTVLSVSSTDYVDKITPKLQILGGVGCVYGETESFTIGVQDENGNLMEGKLDIDLNGHGKIEGLAHNKMTAVIEYTPTDAHENVLTVVFTPFDTTTYKTVTQKHKFTPNKRKLTATVATGVEKEYDGTANFGDVPLELDVSNMLCGDVVTVKVSGVAADKTPGVHAFTATDILLLGSDRDNYELALESVTGFVTITNPIDFLYMCIIPSKTCYTLGETLDLTGATMKVRYRDNTEALIPITVNMVTGFDSNTVGTQYITVTYEGFTTGFYVKVEKPTEIVPDPVVPEEPTIEEEEQKTKKVSVGDTWTDKSKKIKYRVTSVKKNGIGTVTVFKYVGSKSVKSITINGTVKIKGKTFQVTGISKNAFKNLKKLKTITIKSKKIKSIGKNAFYGIYKKAVFKVPSSKYKTYKKLLKASCGFRKTMKVKK